MHGLTDILRLNLHSWTRTLDSRHKSIVILDADDEAAEAWFPNRYVVDMVVRIQDPRGTSLVSWRLHLTRRGLQQVRRVEEVGAGTASLEPPREAGHDLDFSAAR